MSKIKNKFCLFCENKGIKAPHDHTVKDFKKKEQPIICPELLKNKCTYCHKSGHTKYYCQKLKKKTIKKEKELIAVLEKNDNKNYIINPTINNEKKRERDNDNSDDDLNQHTNKILKSNLLNSFIEQLSINNNEKN